MTFFLVQVPGQLWPTPSVLIPVNSTVLISCTTNLSSSYWSLDLAADSIGPKSLTVIDVGDLAPIQSLNFVNFQAA